MNARSSLFLNAILIAGGLFAYHQLVARTDPRTSKRDTADNPARSESVLRPIGAARTPALVDLKHRVDQLEARVADGTGDEVLPQGRIDEQLIRVVSIHMDEVRRRRVVRRLTNALHTYLARLDPSLTNDEREQLVQETVQTRERMTQIARDLEQGDPDRAADLRHERYRALRASFLDAVSGIVTPADRAGQLHEALSARISLHEITRPDDPEGDAE